MLRDILLFGLYLSCIFCRKKPIKEFRLDEALCGLEMTQEQASVVVRRFNLSFMNLVVMPTCVSSLRWTSLSFASVCDIIVHVTAHSSLISVSCWAVITVILCVELDQNELFRWLKNIKHLKLQSKLLIVRYSLFSDLMWVIFVRGISFTQTYFCCFYCIHFMCITLISLNLLLTEVYYYLLVVECIRLWSHLWNKVLSRWNRILLAWNNFMWYM